ncbi:uncharacterized protein DUF1835 [Thiogranum longum]|uniref:Uncharacterized protein DUF1835 n=2 Tax=Thiogranum longum TaxID=1537524 RepID=A0A4R1HJT7_9GAMM|nr:uncharacterized protein DUF1835 [Thiogranum longum]
MEKTTLSITNGDSAAAIMRAAGIHEPVLPWRDILHDGPVPGELTPDELAAVRARFLAQPPVGNYEVILQGFRERDDRVRDFRRFRRVTIWLEHDLYDQLQLLQLLDRFAEADWGETELGLICIDRFPGIEPFYGLGQLNAEQMATLAGSEQPVTEEQLTLGQQGWRAFTSETPLPLQTFMHSDLSVLPFLKAALERHLEEFPDSRNGLSRHERQILELVDFGIVRPGRLFAAHQQLEAAPYLGDWGFWNLIEGLTNVENALLRTSSGSPFVRPPDVPADDTFREQQLELTPFGRSVLNSEANWIELNPPDRWKGGVHLHPDKSIWCWDSDRRSIVEKGS